MEGKLGSTALLVPSTILFKIFLDHTSFHEGVHKMECASKLRSTFEWFCF